MAPETPKANFIDPDIEKAFIWLLSFLTKDSWKKRKEEIENQITIKPSAEAVDINDMAIIGSTNDKMGWYLYLIECYLYDIAKYEPIQGARIAPIFSRLGNSMQDLLKIEGLEKKIGRLFGKEKNQADAILFEILTALLWVRNGWEVKFLPESPPLKQPDLFAQKDGKEWYIECKRLSKSSDYSQVERKKRTVMLSYLSDLLLKLNLVLDIIFHVEITSLEDNFLYKQLHEKLLLVIVPGILISTELIEVRVYFIDFEAINTHLEIWNVKYPSTQVAELIAGKRTDLEDFTCGVKARFVPMSTGKGNHQYIHSIEKAFGVYWKCDSSEAINAKSRDVWRQLKSAVEQLPIGKNCAVHIGIETLDGTDVEVVRFNKIFNTVSFFDTENKDLKWITCHFFQSYTPPQQDWIIDETVTFFSKDFLQRQDPLKEKFLIIPWDGENVDDVHWNRPKPGIT